MDVLEATARSQVSPLLPNQRHLFDIPHDVAYLNCAAIAPQMRSVRAAGEAALTRSAQPWRFRAADWFTPSEELRHLFAGVIGASAESVALIPAASYGLAVAAANLEAGANDKIILVAEDFPSNVYTWRAFAKRTGATIVTVTRESGQPWAEALCHVIDEQTKVVAVPNVHWTDGALIDLNRVAHAARVVGAALVVDASQSIGAMPYDVGDLRPDYLVSVGYKWLLGPLGLGYLYVDAKHHAGVPLEQNWISRAGSENFATLVDYHDAYRSGARRFDVGQRTHFTLTPMAIAALTQVRQWEVSRIAATLSTLTARIEEQARALGLEMTSDPRAPHIIGIRLPKAVLETIAAALAENRVFVGVRGPAIRVSPHLHVTDEDIERLFDTLAKAL
jgi:selenocysteine lyase/cysteine desulfurase